MRLSASLPEGRGISVTPRRLRQLAELRSHAPERIVDAVWGETTPPDIQLVVRVVANDRSGLLRDIDHSRQRKMNVLGVASRSDANNNWRPST